MCATVGACIVEARAHAVVEVVTTGSGDHRTSPMAGATKLQNEEVMRIVYNAEISACEKAEKGAQLSTLFIVVDLSKVDKTILIAAISACEKVERGA